MRKLTKEEFIRRSVEKYGEDAFDYSFADYTVTDKNLELVCKKHGTHFIQTPNNHLGGAICCPCCRDDRNEQNILSSLNERLNKKFGDIYTVHSVNVLNKLVHGNCKIHGDFVVPRSTAVHGTPCRHCRTYNRPSAVTKRAAKLDTDSFVLRATEKFGPSYSYEKANIIDRDTPVIIVCPEHGEFLISPANHLRSRKGGCKKCVSEACGDRFRHTHEEWVRKIKEVHGDKYKIVSTNITGNTHVILSCELHGEFSIHPSHAVEGQGCSVCSNLRASEDRRTGFEGFYRQAVLTHGNKYEYFPEEYVDARTDIRIVCKEHGVFWQKPYNHTSRSGCPSCASYGYSRTSEGSVYLLESDNWIKVGITNRSVASRVANINSHSPEKMVEVYSISDTGDICWKIERKMLSWLKAVSTPVKDEFDGSTETFLKIDRESAIKKLSEIHKEIKNE